MSEPAKSINPLPEPPWSSLRGRPTGPVRQPLTREAITGAALRIVDDEGLAQLSMRRLAQELGVAAASLYGHVSGRDEVLELLLNRVASEVDRPAYNAGNWQSQLRTFLRSLRSTLAAHNDLAGAAIGNIPTGPNWMRMVDYLLGLLITGRVPTASAAYASDLLVEVAITDAYESALFAARSRRQPTYFADLTTYLAELPAQEFPHIAALVEHLTAGGGASSDARFEFALNLLLQSLTRAPPPAVGSIR